MTNDSSSKEKSLPSRGLGDTIEKILLKIGISQAKVKSLLGIQDCGCDNRKEFLNRIFPY